MPDGTSLNAKLAAMMPLEPGTQQRIEDANAIVVEDTEYTVTATPTSEWYGVVSAGRAGEVIGDTAGAPVSFSLAPTVIGDNIRFSVTAGASATGTDEGQFSMVLMDFEHQRQE